MDTIKQLLPYIQIMISVLLIVSILLQQKGAGGGLGGAFGGGGGGGGNVYATKRGLEKILFRASVVLATLFILAAFLNILI